MLVTQRRFENVAVATVLEEKRVARDAMARLYRSPYSALRNVACDFRDGVLILRGRLSSYYLKQIAQEVVSEVDGVQTIVNEIVVSNHFQPMPD